jgi:hypothetical protein
MGEGIRRRDGRCIETLAHRDGWLYRTVDKRPGRAASKFTDFLNTPRAAYATCTTGNAPVNRGVGAVITIFRQPAMEARRVRFVVSLEVELHHGETLVKTQNVQRMG